MEKLKNTIEYGINKVKQVAESRFWCTSHANCFKCSEAEKESHIRTKFERYLYHIKAGRTVYTELILKKGMGRPDLIIVDKGFIWAEEICVSEKEASIIKKKKKYPFLMKVIKIKNEK